MAEAAITEGVARIDLDMDAYREQLESRLGKDWALMRTIINKARYDHLEHLANFILRECCIDQETSND